MIALMYIAVILISYTLGSIPFGLIISKKFANTDIRQVGSGKIGTTNVLRTAGKKAAALALILDIGKGALSVLIASLIFSSKNQPNDGLFSWSDSARALAALSAIAGHSWSIFLRFKGGRGVATFIGGLFALYWPAGIVGGVFILGIGFRTKYMSLGSIIGAITAFIMLMSFNIARLNFLKPYPPFEYVIFSMISAIFIYVMHRDNITRLFNGTERKLGDRVKAETSPSASNPK